MPRLFVFMILNLHRVKEKKVTLQTRPSPAKQFHNFGLVYGARIIPFHFTASPPFIFFLVVRVWLSRLTNYLVFINNVTPSIRYSLLFCLDLANLSQVGQKF